MNKKRLSPKGQEFCREYLACGVATTAYMKVYGTEDSNQASVRAANMLKKEEVQEYLSELRAPLEQSALAERQRRIDKLWAIIDNPASKDSDKLRGLDILARMAGDYKVLPTDDGASIDLSNLSEEELKALTDN